MRIRLSRSLVPVICLCIGVAIVLLTLPDRPAALLCQPGKAAAGGVVPSTALRVEMLGLPAVIYVGESLSYLIHIENTSGEPLHIRVAHDDPWGRQEQTLTVPPNGAADPVFSLRAPAPVVSATASVSLRSVESRRLLGNKVFHFMDGRGPLPAVSSTGRHYANARGEPVVLVNAYEDETEYRRWAPVKWAAREWQRHGAPTVLNAPEAFLAEGGLPLEWTLIPYGNDPIAACLELPSRLPDKGASFLCLAWGFEEAVRGLPAREFQRALDLTIDRVRRRNPAIQIVLATPPPSPSVPSGTAGIPDAIRALAREHHCQVIDLAAALQQEKNWQRMFTLDADGAIVGLYPQVEGLRLWRTAVVRGIVNRESLVPEDAQPCAAEAGRPFSLADAVPCSSPEGIAARFPGIVTFSRPNAFAHAPKTVSVDIFVPADAPLSLRFSLFVKDKDGLWFQSEPVRRMPAGRWQTVRFAVEPGGHSLSARGHSGVWNSYYAGHAVGMGLQFYAPAEWKGVIQIGNLRTEQSDAPSGLPLRIVDFQQLTRAPAAYEMMETAFDLSVPVLNPFDPDAVDVTAVFTSPSGRTFSRPAFYYQGYSRSMGEDRVERVTPAGKASWRVRYVPLEAGRHTWVLRVKVGDRRVDVRPPPFLVAGGSPRGFPAVSKADPRYFITADGEFFYPMGLNIHAPFDDRSAKMLGTAVLPNRGTYAYDYYLEKMSMNRMNAMVMWMSNWWVSIEWSRKWKGFGGLSDYNMGNAWRLDHVLNSAARNGVYINLVLDNHGKYSGYVDSEWPTSPYNIANGGPCATPEEFFISDAAFRAYSRRLRYIIARWGHHPNLLGLEIVSELNLVGTTKDFKGDPSHAAWVKRVAAYLDAIDAYRRPITIQYSNDWRAVDPKVARLPEVDYIVGDAYKEGGTIVPLMLRTAQENAQYGKPTFSAEFGGNWNGTTPSRLHADLHCGLWANAMTQSAAAPFFWWFDFVDRYNLYPEFAVLHDFMRQERRIGRRLKTIEIEVNAPVPADTRRDAATGGIYAQRSRTVKAIALCGEDGASFYVYNDLHSEMMPDPRHAGLHRGATLRVPLVVPAGATPHVEVWNTFDGTRSPAQATSGGGREVVIRLPDFKIDLAGRVTLRPDPLGRHGFSNTDTPHE
jgi:hypothetical protein